MSPTVLKQNGYRLYFYSNDHTPIHVHVEGGESSMKYDLENNEIVKNNGMKKIEIKKVVSIIDKNRVLIMEKWKDYFSKNI